MGWEDEYPFEFTINETTVRDFGPALDLGEDPNDRDAMDAVLEELVTMVNAKFTYHYGFHDTWEHTVTLEKILHSEEGSAQAVCIGGERSCPPDDCGGISHYQKMLEVLGDDNHPEHNNIKRQLGGPESVAHFNMEDVNVNLRRYSEEWDEIYDETGEIIDNLEDEDYDSEFDDPEDQNDEYESLKHLRSPADLLNDELEKRGMEYWMNDALAKEESVEYKTFSRLVKLGHGEEKSRAMVLEAFSIEWFYDLKHGMDHFDDRYERNLQRLPEKPVEIFSLEGAIHILNKCAKGIPFTAIEYLHDDTSPEATSAIVKALKDFSDHQCYWEDCSATPLWYSLAAEGHLCEELIDPVIGFYDDTNKNSTDWIREQGEYLIGKLAQKYPDMTVQKVLAAIEKDAEGEVEHAVYYLFDVFAFCNIDKYKDRLIALLKRDDISWHNMLASTIAYLQIKEELPVLKEQLGLIKSRQSEKHLMTNWNTVEIEEAITQLETGEDLYPDVDTPLCLRRTTTWREEFADAEEYFYDSDPLQEDDYDLEVPDYFGPEGELPWKRNAQQPIIKENKTGRNDPCPCGSGKKYKKCCQGRDVREGGI